MNDNTLVTAREDSTAFATAWAQFENMIGKNYLDVLNEAVPIQSDFEFDKAFDQIKMNHIVRIVYDKNESTLAKLSSLYSALNMSGASVYILLHNAGGNTEFYIGCIFSLRPAGFGRAGKNRAAPQPERGVRSLKNL